MTAVAKEGGAWLWEVPSRSSRRLSTSLPSCSLLSPPLLYPLLFYFLPISPHLFSPLSSPSHSSSLSISSSPLRLPLSFASHSVGVHPHCWPLSPSRGLESGGQNSHPKSPLPLNIYCCVCTQKLIPQFCWAIPTVHFAFGKSGQPVLAGHNGRAHNAHTEAGWLRIQSTQPGHYHSGAEIHPSVHLIGHSAALNDLSVPCPAIFCLINSFIVHRIKKDKSLLAMMIH